jgi:Multiubiquitin
MSDSKKLVTIVVNTIEHQVEKEEISFDELVKLAFGDNPPTGNDVQIKIAYHHKHGGGEGKVQPGGTVKVKDGMIFDVSATYKS